MCQEPLTEDAKAEVAENAAAPARPEKKNKKLPIYIAVAAAIVVIAVIAAVLGSRNNNNSVEPAVTEPVSGEQVSNETGTDAIGTYTEAQLEGAIARVESEGYTMDNVEFNYYYWGQYYYVVAAYGQNLSSFFDVTKPLDGQMYNDTMTWQDFFIENAISAFIQTKALVFDAAKAGFEMPEETRAVLEQTLLELQSYADEYKDEYADKLIKLAERQLPELSKHIVAKKIMTALDYQKFTHMKKSSFGGTVPIKDQKNPPHITPVDNLIFVGQQSENGGGLGAVILGAKDAFNKAFNKKYKISPNGFRKQYKM